ncbi:MAG: methyltransferase domain-containing protein [Candidatus Omnitrophica bacterium]|nr:methyltransferase domain-containing protein [Candidatus Omnitrophota bacterium]
MTRSWRCPVCSGALIAEASRLRCGCGADYPIIAGIPRLLPAGGAGSGAAAHREMMERTRQSFGFQWTRFGEMVCDFEENFLNYVQPLPPEFFLGKRGLDAGCGFGRHLFNAAKLGAEMVGIDLSAAIDVSARNTAQLPNVTLAQADIYHPPLADGSFDFVYSIGVLHHLPDPEAAFQRLARLVKPGGTMAIWVYSKHRRLTRHLLEAVRRVTAHLPHPVVKALSWLAASIEWWGYIRPYQLLHRLPGLGPWVERWTLSRIKVYAAYPFQVSYADWFDRLAAPIRFYYDPEELDSWFARAGLGEPQLSPTGNYGWRAVGVKPAS